MNRKAVGNQWTSTSHSFILQFMKPDSMNIDRVLEYVLATSYYAVTVRLILVSSSWN